VAVFRTCDKAELALPRCGIEYVSGERGGCMEIKFDWILLLVRLVLGAGMIYYGWPKARDLRANAKDFEGMGFKPGIFWGTLIAAVEFLGGIVVVLGIY